MLKNKQKKLLKKQNLKYNSFKENYIVPKQIGKINFKKLYIKKINKDKIWKDFIELSCKSYNTKEPNKHYLKIRNLNNQQLHFKNKQID